MNFITKISLLFFILQSKKIIVTSAQSSEIRQPQYPVPMTLSINYTIVHLLLHKVNIETAKDLIDQMKYQKSTYELDLTEKLEPFRDKIYLRNIEIRSIKTNKPSEEAIKLYYDINLASQGIISKSLSFKIYGYIQTDPNTIYAGFRATLKYKFVKISEKKNDTKFSIDMKGEFIENRIRLQQQQNVNDDYTNSTSPYNLFEQLIKGIEPSPKLNARIPQNIQEMLTAQLKHLAPSILLDNINKNEKFLSSLSSVFDVQSPLRDKNYPLWSKLQKPSYFYIRTIPFCGFSFNDVKIKGLWNNDSILIVEPTNNVRVLRTENITGCMQWDQGIQFKPPYELNFTAKQISIYVQLNAMRQTVNVELEDYSIDDMSPAFLKPLQFERLAMYMKPFIESSIASSIMPSFENLKIHTLKEHALKIRNEMEKLIDQTPTEKVDIKSSLSTRSTDNIADEPEPYNYHISFPNVTIKLVSATPQTTKQIQCELFNNSEFTRRIHAALIGKLHLHNKKGNSIAFNFHCNFTSMNFSIIEPNKLDKNNTCEFQLNDNQDIKVELSSSSENKTEVNDDDAKIIDKIGQTIKSTVEQRNIFGNIKSIACLPLDSCIELAKSIDNVLLRFVDNVLKKCSLRRNTITTTIT